MYYVHSTKRILEAIFEEQRGFLFRLRHFLILFFSFFHYEYGMHDLESHRFDGLNPGRPTSFSDDLLHLRPQHVVFYCEPADACFEGTCVKTHRLGNGQEQRVIRHHPTFYGGIWNGVKNVSSPQIALPAQAGEAVCHVLPYLIRASPTFL